MSDLGVDFRYTDDGLEDTSSRLNDFFGRLKDVAAAGSALSFPPINIGLAGAEGTHTAIANMQSALQSADAAATPLAATLSRLEAVLHGAAGVSRIASTAMMLLPQAFNGLPPAIQKTFSAISLASRGFDVFRGNLSPLGGIMGYIEMRNLGLSKSYSALASTLAVATSAIVGAARKTGAATVSIGGTLLKSFGGNVLGAVGGLSLGVMSLLGPFAAVGGAAGGLAFAGAGLKKAFDQGGEISDLSARTGVAIKDLAILQQAFTNAGMSADGVGPSINKLQKALTGVNDEGEPTNKTFAKLGLDMEALKRADASIQFAAIGKSISALADPAERTAAAMGLFGKSGGELLAVFGDSGAIGDAAKDVGSQAEILERNAALFDRISDILGTAGLKFQGFFLGMAEQIAPFIDTLASFFRDTDLSSFGQSFGNAIGLGLQALTDGSIWGIVTDSALIAINNAVNMLWRGLQGVLTGSGQLLLSAFSLAIDAFMQLGKAEFWQGMGNQLLSLANTFNSLLYGAFARIVEMMRPILGKVGLGGMVDKVGGAIRGVETVASNEAARRQGMASENLAPLLNGNLARFGDEAGKIAMKIQEGWDSAPGLIDMSGLEDSLDSRLADVALRLQQTQLAALDKGQGDKKSGKLDFTADGSDKKKAGGSRLFALGGFGVFVRDPVLAENRRQSQLLERIARNTEKPTQPAPGMAPMGFGPLRFSAA